MYRLLSMSEYYYLSPESTKKPQERWEKPTALTDQEKSGMVKADHSTEYIFPKWWVVFPLRNKTISTNGFLMSNFWKPRQAEFNSTKQTKRRIYWTRNSSIQKVDKSPCCPLLFLSEIWCGFSDVVHTILDSLSTDNGKFHALKVALVKGFAFSVSFSTKWFQWILLHFFTVL